MKKLFYSLHLIASIGGGSIGLLTIFPLWDSMDELTGAEVIGTIIFAIIFLAGITSGIIFSLDKQRKGLLGVYYALQIPFIISSTLSYQLVSVCGFQVGINLLNAESGKINFGYIFHHYGSSWSIAWGDTTLPSGGGINLVPCVLLLFLFMINYSNQPSEVVRQRKN